MKPQPIDKPEARAIGSAIKERRTARHLSQEKLARIVDVSREQIRRIEAGESYPSFDLYFNISAALGEPPSKFLRATDGVCKTTRQGVAQLAQRLTVTQQWHSFADQYLVFRIPA